jgi:hypothetical protein
MPLETPGRLFDVRHGGFEDGISVEVVLLEVWLKQLAHLDI